MPTTDPEVASRRVRLWLCLALAAATVAAYWPVRRADFITCDDMDYVAENQAVLQGLTWPGVVWALRTGHAGNWHPLTWLSHMVDVQLFGAQPGPHHLVNVSLHIANTLVVLLLFQSMTGARWRSVFVAALFALHPSHVESVAWVAERKDVLSTFFGLLAIWAYAAYVKAAGRMQREESRKQKAESGNQQPVSRFTLHPSRFYLLSLLLFTLSLMSKPMLVTLPCLLLLLDYWPLNRLQLKTQDSRLKTLLPLLREKLPYLALAAVSSTITVIVQNQGHALLSVETISIAPRVANALVSYVRYLGKAVWPSHLALPYPYPGTWPLSTILLAAMVLAGVSFVGLRLARSRPYVAVGWFWFLGTLVPVIGLVQVGSQALADRYTYVPLIGLSVLVAWLVPDLLRTWRYRQVALGMVGSAVILACLGRTRVQAGYWQDSETLFRHSLAVTSGNAMAHACLGTAFVNQNREADALTEFSRALTLRPAFVKPLSAMAEAFCAAERLDMAAAVFRRVLEATPNDVAIHCRLGSAVAQQGNLDEAIAHYEAALRLDPQYAPAQTNLAAARARRQSQ